MEPQQSNSVFSVETDAIKPNPHQPRREFNEKRLGELAESIRAYGILQPLVVVRHEVEVATGTKVKYELIAGERRLRAAKRAGITHVPVIIREAPPAQIKLELALIENVQREDLNPLERAEAFKQLMDNFHLKQKEIADRIGKSREFIANSIRLLTLPDTIKEALTQGKISEGHTRPLLMLSDRPEDQKRMLEEIIMKQLSVRASERLARNVAQDRARRKDDIFDPRVREMESMLSDVLGTRVSIERKGPGGRVSIDFFSPEDLHVLLTKMTKQDVPTEVTTPPDPFKEFEAHTAHPDSHSSQTPKGAEEKKSDAPSDDAAAEQHQHDTGEHGKATDEDIKNFTI